MSDKKIKEVYFQSIKLIEMLNVLVSKLENKSFNKEFVDKTCDLCFDVGGYLLDLAEKKESNYYFHISPDEDNKEKSNILIIPKHHFDKYEFLPEKIDIDPKILPEDFIRTYSITGYYECNRSQQMVFSDLISRGFLVSEKLNKYLKET